MAAAKDPDAAFFKKLDGFQPCEITELKTGIHVFAVYGQFLLKLLCLITLTMQDNTMMHLTATVYAV